MPEEQTLGGIGFVDDAAVWNEIWHGANKEDTPDVDFQTEIVIFAHNVDFLNIVHVTAGAVDDAGIVDVIAIQTKTAHPINDFVYWSAGTIPIAGLAHLRVADGPVDLVVVPEPASFALLGLGSLLMLRRRVY